MLIAFHKPYGVLSQFTGDGSANRPLAEFGFPQNVYPIGRLDADSEGLLLLSDEPEWNERLLHPKHAHEREYWAQVERIPTPAALKKLERGVVVQGRKTVPCRAWILEPQPEVGSSRCDDLGDRPQGPAQRAVPTGRPGRSSVWRLKTAVPGGETRGRPPKPKPRRPPATTGAAESRRW